MNRDLYAVAIAMYSTASTAKEQGLLIILRWKPFLRKKFVQTQTCVEIRYTIWGMGDGERLDIKRRPITVVTACGK